MPCTSVVHGCVPVGDFRQPPGKHARGGARYAGQPHRDPLNDPEDDELRARAGEPAPEYAGREREASRQVDGPGAQDIGDGAGQQEG